MAAHLSRWVNLLEKLRSSGKPLGGYVKDQFYRGVTTGLNNAFVINQSTRDRLVSEEPKSAEIIKPWLRGKDVNVGKSIGLGYM